MSLGHVTANSSFLLTFVSLYVFQMTLSNPSIFSLSTTNEKSSQENTYYTKRKEREEREADLRKFHMKKKSSDVLIEEIEIVEDFSTA